MRFRGRLSASAVAGLLALHVVLVWSAASTKSPAYDEGLYVLSGIASYVHGDDRVSETPAPWTLVHTFPHLADPPPLRLEHPRWADIVEESDRGNRAQWDWSIDVLWRTPGVDGRELVAASRRWVIVYPLLLGAILALWTRRLGGPLAATVAVAVFALDPTLIGHGGVVKEDVLMSMLLLALSWATWRVGVRATPGRVVGLGVLIGLGLCTKHSGVVSLPLVALLLMLRALLPEPWSPGPWTVVGVGELNGRGRKVGAAVAVTLAVGLVAWVTLWAGYGFRFAPTPDADVLLVDRSSAREAGETAGAAKLAGAGFQWAEDARLIPQHWSWGIRQLTRLRGRWCFLRGEVAKSGWWYYFLVAFLVKVPLATLLAVGLSFSQAGSFVRPSRRVGWALLCLGVPLGIYAVAALASGMNIGFRHVLPPYVLSFPLIGLAAAAAWERWGQRAGLVLAGLGAVLLVECLVAFPNYIAYFNPIAGGTRGGIEWLGDSNLDWGQDLQALAEWRQRNPEGPLYLCYFGTADPAAFGLEYVNLPGGYMWGPPAQVPKGTGGVIAISATHLQGIYLNGRLRRYYAQLWRRPPIAVLGGGTIYVFARR